ncbi:MAG: hypothetical protein IPJ14_06990 [Kineosporiaceae bacterium]|nr:hypothetical protein [Kineosporiaceae bacterium]
MLAPTIAVVAGAVGVLFALALPRLLTAGQAPAAGADAADSRPVTVLSSSSAAPNAQAGPAPSGPALDDAARRALWPLPASCHGPGATWAPGSAPRVRSGMSAYQMPGADLVVDYQVEPEGLTPTATGSKRRAAPTDCARRLWRVITAVYPDDARALITHLVIFDGTGARDPDDRDVSAFVQPVGENLTSWVLAVDPGFDDGEALADTLVHELGHLLTLNPQQIDLTHRDSPTCTTEPTSEGCSVPGSIYDSYVRQAWDPAVLDEWWQLYDASDGELSTAEVTRFHRRHADHFVEEYAASDPEEDFAVTFAAWCLGRPASSPPVKRKLAYLDSRPELTGMTQRCRLIT